MTDFGNLTLIAIKSITIKVVRRGNSSDNRANKRHTGMGSQGDSLTVGSSLNAFGGLLN